MLVKRLTGAYRSAARPSWVALHGIAHSFIELDKAVVHVIKLVSFLETPILWPPDGKS